MTDKRPDAVFINPAFGFPIVKDKGLFYTKQWPPLSLAYSAALMLERGLSIGIVDAQTERWGPEEAARRAAGAGLVFVSSSSLDRWQCPVNEIRNVYDVVRSVRNFSPESRIVLIGAHGTTFPEKALRESGADAAILGEPEIVARDLAAGRPLEEIDGVALRTGDSIVVRPKTKDMSLNELPRPAFHLLPMAKYQFEFLGGHFALMEISRGCPFTCTFCYKSMYGPYRVKTSRKIIDEVAWAMDEFGVRNVYFADLTFTVNKKQVLDLCDYLIARRAGLRWACQTRFDLVDEPLLRKMSEAGCRLIQFGIESGVEDIVRSTNKYIPPKTISEGLRIVRRLGMESVAFMMFGLPGETDADRARSLRFVKKLDPTYVAFNLAIPYTEPVPPVWQSALENEGVFFPDAYPGFTKVGVEKAIAKAMMAFYLRPRTLFKMLRNPFSLLQKIKLFLAVAAASRR
jgi:anaerobic magnesium-protoporphyrin IX monomethyl ester cyclase